ncbi:Rieske 2Fe-2S domain-containing protein [Candidatus Poribacteria bacterium]|nr:Rieske 2Fe-2S domain-containing protein [Candidatus Poribacteria bacterium]
MELNSEKDQPIRRRSFLNYFLGLSIGTFGGSAAYAFAKYLFPPAAIGAESGSETVRVMLAELPIGGSKIVRYKGEPTVVIRVSEKQVHALSAVCTHLGCIVKWDGSKRLLVCPCHAATFDVNGNVTAGPAPKPLASYHTKITPDEVIIGEA